MEPPFATDASGMNTQPLAFFLHGGAYGSFVLCTVSRDEDEDDFLAPMQRDNLWDRDHVQLTPSAIFFSVGSDAINQALWVYLDTPGKADSPERSLSATFSSRGEQVYLESLIDMTFGTYCDQFFLPKGEYEIRFLSWNIERARDNSAADPKLFLENVHHELHFTSTANELASLLLIPDDDADRHALNSDHPNSPMTISVSEIDPHLPMGDLLAVYPGAQRALFRKYHVGGCSSCGFAPTETLAQIVARNPHMDLPEVTAFLQTSQEEDRAMQITPGELRAALDAREPAPVHLLDIRTREEWEAVHIDGAQHFTQELMNTILMTWPREAGLIALLDHQGARSLDAAAYFAGHGFTNVKAVLGGIDAWSQQVDPDLPRYQLE